MKKGQVACLSVCMNLIDFLEMIMIMIMMND